MNKIINESIFGLIFYLSGEFQLNCLSAVNKAN